MAFINKEDPIVLNIMLTSKGRERLSTGNLTFKYFSIGDSEIDYNFLRNVKNDVNYTPNLLSVLKPKDKNPDIISHILKDNSSSNTFEEIPSISTMSYDVTNNVESLGFFTNNNTEYIKEATHVKQPDIIIEMSGVTGGTIINLKKSVNYGVSVLEPDTNDFIYIKWTTTGDTSGYMVNNSIPNQNLMYRIISKTGLLSDNTLKITVDRVIPNYYGIGATGISGAFIFRSDISDINESTDYLTQSVIDFIENYQCGISKFPFWNLSIIFTDEIAGIQLNDKKFTTFNTRDLGSFVSYIQNQSPYFKKLGLIHYSNNSPNNTYGEEFNSNTPKLVLPDLVWHKSTTLEKGLTLIADNESKLLTGSTKSLNIQYYDLIDEDSGYVVGKVFNGLKIFVIEDQELLYAMSYKSNRSWTLPNYLLGTAGSNPCQQTTLPPIAPTMYDIVELECNKINVSWSESTGSGSDIKYILYRKTNIDTSWVIIADRLTTRTYTQDQLIDGVTYYYKVVAINEFDMISQESNISRITINCVHPPTTPFMNEITIFDEENYSFDITWTQSITLNTPISYAVYRKDNINTEWVLINNITQFTNYVDYELIAPRTYSYKVIAIDSIGLQSNESNTVSKTVPNPT
jgi:hypothetical protein